MLLVARDGESHRDLTAQIALANVTGTIDGATAVDDPASAPDAERPMTVDLPRPAVKPPLHVKVTGALEQVTVVPLIKQHAQELASCRERPEVAIDLELDIGANGRVIRARSPKQPDREKTADCLTHRARFWTFPVASGTSRVTIQWR